MATGTLVTVEQLAAALDVDENDDRLPGVVAAANATLLPWLKGDTDYTGNAVCLEAGIAVGQQLWQARSAPGGQMVQMDFGPVAMPHLLGPGLILRLRGLLGPIMTHGGYGIA